MGSDRILRGDGVGSFVRFMEAQGCTVKKTKRGFIVTAPNGETASTHTSMGDIRGVKNDIANFRRIGIRHPKDTRPITKESDMVETTDEGYPVYLTKPINSTTRKAVLSDLEAKGWPLVVQATDLAMDSTTAARALYNVGYRWGDTDEPSKRNRTWHAPQEIVDLHTKAKAEAERREQEARDARRHIRLLPSHVTVSPSEDPAITAVRAVQRIHEASTVNREADKEPDMPEGRAEEAERLLREAMQDRKLSSGEGIAGPPTTATSSEEREFIDSVDSWVVEFGYPREVYDYLDALRGAGLEVEIRVWRR